MKGSEARADGSEWRNLSRGIQAEESEWLYPSGGIRVEGSEYLEGSERMSPIRGIQAGYPSGGIRAEGSERKNSSGGIRA